MKALKSWLCILLIVGLAACGSLPPEPDAGENQTVTLGKTVTLDATGSDRRNGEPLKYYWTIIAAPTGSTAQLSDPNSATPAFTPDRTGAYTFALVVDNKWHESEPVEVKVTCIAAPAITTPAEPAPTENPAPTVFATDPSGEIILTDFAAVELWRNAVEVSHKLAFVIENKSAARANIETYIHGMTTDGLSMSTTKISAGLDPGEKRLSQISSATKLTIEEFDSIVAWEIDPLAVY